MGLDLGPSEVAGERLDLALLRRELEVHGGHTNDVRLATAIILAAIAVAGCGSHHTRSPSEVARSWSADLNRNDNEDAARLFVDGAKVVQGDEMILADHAAAVQWNAGLPCGGKIVSVQPQGKTDVLVIFRLVDRPNHQCDDPGGEASALFRVRDGQIELWHQTEVPEQPTGATV
jgi:hypothetical protein